MPIRISGDGTVAGNVRTKKVPVKHRKTKKEREDKSEGVQRGPKGCPYATLIGKTNMGDDLYECSMWLNYEKQDQIDILEPIRLGEGAELCLDCDRRPHIVEWSYE